MASSFIKKSSLKRRETGINATKVSLHNNQLLISSGIPGLDSLVGGGLTVGSVLLLKEDRYSTYSDLILKYYVAEGVVSGHVSFLASNDLDTDDFIKTLPCPVNMVQEDEPPNVKGSDEELKIAWRYKHLPRSDELKKSTIPHDQFGHYYDLTKKMPDHILNSSTIVHSNQFGTTHYDESRGVTYGKGTTPYHNLFHLLRHEIETRGFDTTGAKVEKNILRVALHSLGSPLWTSQERRPHYDEEQTLLWFLVVLKGLIRSSLAVCIVTLPVHLFQDRCFIRRLEQTSDIVLEIESFAGSEKEHNPAYKEYHGLLFVQKQTHLNCLMGQNIDTSDMAFKLKRKKFTIEWQSWEKDIGRDWKGWHDPSGWAREKGL